MKNCNNIVKEYKSEADSKTGKNKFKRFRYILKDGHKSIEHYGKLMFEKGKYDYIYHIKDNGDICINSAIDYTELADILNKKG